MSRKKDRERFLAMKQLNPNYQGFRGQGVDSATPDNVPLQSMTCSVCGKKRNVPTEVALEEGEGYVCLSCREEEAQASESSEG